MKRILNIVSIIGLLLVFLLAACSGQGEVQNQDQPENQAAVNQPEEVADEGGICISGAVFEQALDADLPGRELRQVASRRVQRSLRLMQRTSTARLDLETCREIALRDGGVHAVVAGRIEPAGPAYRLTVEVGLSSSKHTLSSPKSSVCRGEPAMSAMNRNIRTSARSAFQSVTGSAIGTGTSQCPNSLKGNGSSVTEWIGATR